MNIGEMKYFYWGPFLMQQKIKEEHRNELLKKGNKTHLDYRQELAGLLDKENLFSEDDTRWFANAFNPYFQNYLNGLKDYNKGALDRITKIKNLHLNKLWINFMEKNEFNPPHIHSDDFSFVIYLQIPKGIYDTSWKGTSSGPGSITFTYGNPSSSSTNFTNITGYDFKPEVGDMFIFPANLQHYVNPFKVDGTRISVSGNLDCILNDNI